ncbi:MAG: ISNCY family transposase [Proteobacteria bacterium]|nr:ISNCY family transposase [Pseudomonadota bacterium]
MSQNEAQRYAVIERVLQGHASQAVAAQQLGLSVRQIKRLCAGVRQHGAGALISRRRGQPSNRRIGAERKSAIMSIVAQHYGDFGPQLACEYLADVHGQAIGVETLRGWMIEAGLWQARRRRKARQHLSRPRRDRLGELVQIDGSHHDWFEGRAPKCCLIAFIDDASGQVLAAHFSPTETTQAYFAVLSQHVSAHGVPLAYYSDRHGIFTKHDRDDPAPTQFERALLQLGIEGICASTPQAKGRVERLFQTLQDRLCKAMRLLEHRAYTLHEHLRGKRSHDDKTINQRVDALARQQRRLARLHAELALQDDLRRMDTHRPDTHVSAPPQLGRCGLRPAQPSCGAS